MRRIKKRNTTRSNYVNAHKYMVDMYNQEAKDKQVSGVTKEYPLNAYCNILLKEKRIVKPKVKLVKCKTENFSVTFTNKLTEWINEKHFDYFCYIQTKKN